MAFLKTRVGTFYDKEILKYPVGLEATRNIVIDGTTVPVDSSSGRYVLQAGQLMVNNTGQSGINAVQTVNIPDDASSGAFQLISDLGTTPGDAGGSGLTVPLNWNMSAADLQAALEALPNIGAGDVAVTGLVHTAPKNVYTVTFQNRLAGAPVPALKIVNSSVNGTQANLVVTVVAAGQSAIATAKAAPAAASGVSAGAMLGILTHTVEFFYPPEPNVTDEPAAVYFHQCIFDSTKLLSVSGNLAAVQAAFPTCLFQ